MIDQYIYTRLDSGDTKKDYGHGLATITAGITKELQVDVSAISRYSNTTVDGEGRRVKVFEKRNLGEGHFAAFQQSVRFAERSAAGDLDEGDKRLLYYSSTNRPQFLSHGYVCDIYDPSGTMVNPDRWFNLNFIDYNVNLKQPVLEQMEELPAPAAPLEPLTQVLEKSGLTLESFITAVRASFDTENRDTIELIELDFTRPDAQELGAQLLRWIFHFLPFAMRRQADFSSCYDSGCGGHDFAIALIPSAMLVQERSGRVTFKGMPSSVKYGYMFANGRCFHQKLSDRPDFDTSGSLFACWLEQVIRLVYDQPHEAGMQILADLDQIYRAFDTMIRPQPDKTQCRTEFYDALCWVYLCGALYHGGHILAADEAVAGLTVRAESYVEALLSFEDKSVLRELVPNILDSACTAAAGGYNTVWPKLICRVKNEVAPTQDVQETLDIYLAKLFENESVHTLKPALNSYFGLVVPNREASEYRLYVLERMFFPAEALNNDRWTLAKASNSPEAGENRVALWIEGEVTERRNCSVYIAQTKNIFRTFAAFTPEHLTALLDKKLIPTMDVTSCTFSDVGVLVACVDDLEHTYASNPGVSEKINDFYCIALKDSMLECCERNIQNLSRNPTEIITCLKEIRSAFEPVLKIRDGAELIKHFQDKSLQTWVQTASDQVKAHNKKLTYLEDDPELHQRMVSELVAAYRAGADVKWISLAYQVTVGFLMGDSYTHRTRKWLEEAPDIYNQLREVPETSKIGISAINAACRYIKSERLDYLTFECVCIDQDFGRQNNSDKALSFLIELFDRGELPELEAEMVVYYAVRKEERAGKDQRGIALTEGFEKVLRKKGVRSFIDLIDLFPSSAKRETEPKIEEEAAPFGKLLTLSKKLTKRSAAEDEEEYIPRKGRYPWMYTNRALLDALEGAIGRQKALIQAEMQADEMIGPDLITAVFALVPPESQLRASGRRINGLLNVYWEDTKPTGSAEKKAMNELRKKGAFHQGR